MKDLWWQNDRIMNSQTHENNGFSTIAFGSGSDARINGVTISRNPFDERTRGWAHWRLGWLHAHFRWGIDRKHNGMLRLPEVTDLDYAKMLREMRVRRSRDLVLQEAV